MAVNLMLDLPGICLTEEDASLLQHPKVGGLILFARNYVDKAQILALITSIRNIRPQIIIAVDQEGGRVQRLVGEFTQIPPMSTLGRAYDADPDRALLGVKQLGWKLAAELIQVGIDMSFAPVLDLDYGRSQVIGNRAFHHDPKVVGAMAKALMAGFSLAGMSATAKHFPGHGYVAADSHQSLPVDNRPLRALELNDLQPFIQLIQAGLQAIMPAHIIYSEVDPHPAGFSHFWLTQYLRKQLGFKGLIFSDDLNMAGAEIAGNFAQRTIKAATAGCNVILVCNNRPGAIEALDALVNCDIHNDGPSIDAMAANNKRYQADLNRYSENHQVQRFIDSLVALEADC